MSLLPCMAWFYYFIVVLQNSAQPPDAYLIGKVIRTRARLIHDGVGRTLVYGLVILMGFSSLSNAAIIS